MTKKKVGTGAAKRWKSAKKNILHSVFVQISSCLTSLIKTEKEAEVRRAAVHVIASLLRGLGDKSTQVHSHSSLGIFKNVLGSTGFSFLNLMPEDLKMRCYFIFGRCITGDPRKVLLLINVLLNVLLL